LFEAVAFDPGDEIRHRYGELARQLGKQLDAARLLSRAATGVKEVGLRARLGTEVGEIYLAAKDPKRARSAFASVVESAGGDDPAVLNAARALVQLHAEAKEHKSLAQMLELLSRIEPHETARCAAAERLGQHAEHELADRPRAIQAWRSLLGSPLHEQALEALERLFAETQSYTELIDVLEKRVDLATNASAARALALRAAELRTEHTKDRARAIVAWIDFLGAYGSSREVHARVIPP
jgi:tetratricopeptide (TPR) repeat protein